MLDCEEGAALACGLNRKMSKDEFRRAIKQGTVMDYMQVVPVKKGDVFFIEAGTLHAIGAGILIAEIQQSSNLTYRVYDYDRVGADGQPRELHLDKAVDVTKTWPAPPRRNLPLMDYQGYSVALIADCPFFTVTELHITEGAAFPASAGLSYTHLLCTEGDAALIYDDGVAMPVKKGDSVFLPANFGAYSVRGKHCSFLCTQTLPRKI